MYTCAVHSSGVYCNRFRFVLSSRNTVEVTVFLLGTNTIGYKHNNSVFLLILLGNEYEIYLKQSLQCRQYTCLLKSVSFDRCSISRCDFYRILPFDR